MVATAAIAGLTYSRTPEKIWRGSVRWSGPATKSVTTSSSSEVAKANKAPEATPGKMIGSITRRNAVQGEAPRLEAARNRFWSNPSSVTSTVMTTKGTASTACARISPG
jgi:hypothetical protein